MHAILASLGTDGDVIPYVGLGARLRARGHRVTVAANENFRSLALEHGLAFHPLVTAEETRALFANPDFWDPLKGSWVAARWGAGMIGRQYRLLAELASDPDVVLAAVPMLFAARLVQETMARPLASIVLQPWMVPSMDAPPVMPGGLTLPRRTPRPLGDLYWRMIDVTAAVLVGGRLNRVRASLGLGPVNRIFRWWYSPQRVLGLFPDWYGLPQADWPTQMRLTGFPHYDGRPGAGLPADVRDFLRAGPPPVVFTFGTAMLHAAHFFRSAVKACQLLGVRGLLMSKYARQIPAVLPPGVHHAAFAPFHELFPHCAAVVHHGGVGTTARALAAGVPQLILPLAYDQTDNAVRVQKLGVGDWLNVRGRSGGAMARTLQRLLGLDVRDRCRAAAAHFGQEDGLEAAAEWMEELAERGRR
ncbi:MAG TPA: nucleotide disphospho-sugar-binding domain-containing protein [Gemmataceae bacterium]|nr:nucleotide disphospho-sugar-binding domain-containing protein [Gemmataceae bacterium]